MKFAGALRLTLVSCALATGLFASAQVTPVPPYTVSTFTTSITGVDFDPDSIVVADGSVFIGFGDGAAPDGSDGKSSTIVRYSPSGDLVATYTVLGHNDGLRQNPKTGDLWAMQNEDANPNLVIIDPKTGAQTVYTFGPTPHGGGYDDIAFRDNDVFLSCSNPSNNPNTAPAIVKATISGTTVNVTPVLYANATAIDIPTNTPVTLNLQDPDSMFFDRFGNLVLDSQADGELIIVQNPGFPNQAVYHLALTDNGAMAQIDDTVLPKSRNGILLVSDLGGETVYAISRNIFSPTAAYSATGTTVGELNFDTGVITDIVTGLVSPHGMAFINEQK